MKYRFITVLELKNTLNVKKHVLKEFKFIGPPLRLILRLGIEVALY